MAPLPDSIKAILDQPNFAHLATVMADGSPQVTPVWIHRDGDRVVFNTADGRVKINNIRRDPRVAISIAPADDPYRSVAIRGRVVGITTDGADGMIDALAKKYLGADTYPFRQEGEVRLTVTIEVDAVTG